MSNRGTENQRHIENQDTEGTHDVPPVAACVNTLEGAIHLSLKAGLTEDSLFTLSRALKALEVTAQRRLNHANLDAAFSLWWKTATPLLPSDADFDEYRFVFNDTFAKTRSALGANTLLEAIRLAKSNPMPTQAARYQSPALKLLVAVCFHLQLLQGDNPFFLSVRDAAKILGTKCLRRASSMLAGLMSDGILIKAGKANRGRRRAARYRFNLSEPGTINLSPAPPES